MPALTTAQVTAILFNETRSLSGASIVEARTDVAHAIMNAARSSHRFPRMAPSTARIGPGEAAIFADCSLAAAAAESNVRAGRDPTDGAEHFNFRKSDSRAAFQGHPLKTSSGPLDNSYPTTDLPASGVYANTYA